MHWLAGQRIRIVRSGRASRGHVGGDLCLPRKSLHERGPHWGRLLRRLSDIGDLGRSSDWIQHPRTIYATAADSVQPQAPRQRSWARLPLLPHDGGEIFQRRDAVDSDLHDMSLPDLD